MEPVITNKKTIINTPFFQVAFLGIFIGISSVPAKHVVTLGINPQAIFIFQLVVATFILFAVQALRNEKISLEPRFVRYCLISGLLSVTGPHLIAYIVLAHIPLSVHAAIITFSPLCTFIIASLNEKQLLPLSKLAGILLGLIGVSMTVYEELYIEPENLSWLLLAIAIPILLAAGNVYRNKAYPDYVSPTAIAAFMLLLQILLSLPVFAIQGTLSSPFNLSLNAGLGILCIGIFTAFGYVITFAIQRTTDGVGFSHVGYFATIGGVTSGIIVFGDGLKLNLLTGVLFLFLGLAITNGHWRILISKLKTTTQNREI